MALDTDAGIGVGALVTSTPTTACPNLPATHLSLEEYWEFLQINECAGYGIRNFPTTGVIGLGCGDYWNYQNRYFLAASIQKAERRLEADRWLGFPLRRQYYTTKQLPYSWPFALGKHLRGVGVETNTLVENVSLSLSPLGVIADPITFTVTVDFTDANELILRYPGETCLIRPNSVAISGTTATVTVSRCRLLKAEFHKDYANDPDRPDYEDNDNFLDTVDVYRNYLNTTTGANLVWWRHKGQLHCSTDVTCEPNGACADVRQLACPYVENQRMGFLHLEPATYSDAFYKTTYAVKRNPDGIEVNYMRGYYERYEELEAHIKRAVIAIAHNNLPRRYCSCDVQTLWYEDDTRPLEPPIRLGLGRSTWGLYESEQIIREFDAREYSYAGGML